MHHDDHTTTTTHKGAGLARGPALIIGAILAGFGLALFLKNGATPTNGFPDATRDGDHFLGFETNGWTAWFTVLAGVLLLFGAAQHLLAKTMSLIVGLALIACAVISFIDGDDVLGLAAANHITQLGWVIAGGLLLFNTLAPRVRHREHDRTATAPRTATPVTPMAERRETVATTQPPLRSTEEIDRGSSVRAPDGRPLR